MGSTLQDWTMINAHNIWWDLIIAIATPFIVFKIWNIWIKRKHKKLNYTIKQENNKILKNFDKEEISKVKNKIKNQKSVLIFGAQGIGKTSFAEKVLSELEENEYKIIKISAIDFSNEPNIIKLIIKKLINSNSLTKKWKKNAKNVLKIISTPKIFEVSSNDFIMLAKNLIRNAKYENDIKPLIFIDELDRSNIGFILNFINSITVYFSVEDELDHGTKNPVKILYCFDKAFINNILRSKGYKVNNEKRSDAFWDKHINDEYEIKLVSLYDIISHKINCITKLSKIEPKILNTNLRRIKKYLKNLNEMISGDKNFVKIPNILKWEFIIKYLNEKTGEKLISEILEIKKSEILWIKTPENQYIDIATSITNIKKLIDKEISENEISNEFCENIGKNWNKIIEETKIKLEDNKEIFIKNIKACLESNSNPIGYYSCNTWSKETYKFINQILVPESGIDNSLTAYNVEFYANAREAPSAMKTIGELFRKLTQSSLKQGINLETIIQEIKQKNEANLPENIMKELIKEISKIYEEFNQQK